MFIYEYVLFQVQLKCVQTLRSIFSHSDMSVSTPYIHALAPRLVEYLYSDNAKNVSSEAELCVTFEAITTVESLISLAEPQNRKCLLCYITILGT